MLVLMILLATINPHLYMFKEYRWRYFLWTAIRLVSALVVVGFFQFYCFLPAMYWPNHVAIIWLPLLLNAVITLIECAFYERRNSPVDGLSSNMTGLVWIVFGLSMVVLAFTAVSPYYDAESNLRSLPKISLAENLPPEEIPKVNTDHLVVVPPEHAKFKAENVMGKDGSTRGTLYEPSEPVQQRVRGRQVFAIPYVYQDVLAWRVGDGSDAFCLVDAERLDMDPQLVVLDQPMRFQPEGFFWDDLERLIYNRGYQDYTQFKTVFEVDDNLKPWYVVSLSRYSSGLTGDKIVKILLVDPCTGEIQPFEPGQTPEWVDVSNPDDLVMKYAGWWGKYIHGWLNSWITKDEVLKPVGRPIMLYGTGEHPDYFVQMTSHSGNDKAMVGYFLYNSHKNEAVYFKVKGVGFGTSEAICQTIEGMEEVSTPKFHVNWETLYRNIYGEITWVAPVLSPQHQVEMIALVYAENSSNKEAVAIGDTKDEALTNYIEVLAKMRTKDLVEKVSTDSAIMMSASGIVDRISTVPQRRGGVRTYIALKDQPTVIYQVPPGQSPSILSLTVAGDRVSLEYINTGEGVLSVRTFANARFGNLMVSGAQQQFNRSEHERLGTDQKKAEYLRLLEQQNRFEELQKEFGKTVTPDKK